MIKNPVARRALSAALLVLGGVLLFLAPEHVWAGGLLIVSGLITELIAAMLAHGGDDK